MVDVGDRVVVESEKVGVDPRQSAALVAELVAADGQQQAAVAEEHDMSSQLAARPARSLGQHAQLAHAKRVAGDQPICLAKVGAPQPERLRPVG